MPTAHVRQSLKARPRVHKVQMHSCLHNVVYVVRSPGFCLRVERRTLPVHDSLLLRGFFSFVPRLRTFLYQIPHSSLPTMQDKLSKIRAIPTLLTSWFAHDFCEPCANAQIPQEWILLLPRLPTALQQDTSRHFLNHTPATIRFCLSPQFVEENRGEEDRVFLL